jgi:hypothetical protein
MPEREGFDPNQVELARLMRLGEKSDIEKVSAHKIETNPQSERNSPEDISNLANNETVLAKTESGVTYTIRRGPTGNWFVKQGIMEIIKDSPFAAVVKVESGELFINDENKGKIVSTKKAGSEFQEAA